MAQYLLGATLETVESGNAGESARELEHPPGLPKRDPEHMAETVEKLKDSGQVSTTDPKHMIGRT